MINQESLKEILRYSQETGVFTWIKSRGPKAASGSMAGSTHYSGYRKVCISGRVYLAHRLAWLAFHGRWPTDQLDHINGIRDDNRIENLREVSNRDNGRNQATPKNNTSGAIGVHWHKLKRKWQASIRVDGKRVFLGRYEEFTDAVSARKSAEVEYGFHKNHGRPADSSYPSW